jgi:hypothetical protein
MKLKRSQQPSIAVEVERVAHIICIGGGGGGEISARRPTILTGVISGFLKFLQANAGMLPQTMPTLLPVMFFPLNATYRISPNIRRTLYF